MNYKAKNMKEKISVYIHIPFCEKKCPYCNFNSQAISKFFPDEKQILSSYIKAFNFYFEKFPFLKNRELKSIFFGGGTPSLLSAKTIKDIINHIKKSFNIINKQYIETSIEINPNSCNLEKMQQLKSAGINRLSIGVQSLNDNELKFLGRLHDSKTALKAIENGKKVFENISADFIYSLPNQTEKQWENDLQKILSLNLPHLSLYQLTVENSTPMARRKVNFLNEDMSAKLFETTRKICRQNKIPAYEISNFAKENHQCQHNKSYWNSTDYIGIGSGAHGRISDINNSKFYTTSEIKNIEKWFSNIDKNLHTKIRQISIQDKDIEYIITSLRTSNGLKISKLNNKDILSQENIKQLEKQKLLTHKENKITLTEKGFLYINFIIREIISF